MDNEDYSSLSKVDSVSITLATPASAIHTAYRPHFKLHWDASPTVMNGTVNNNY